MARPPAKIMFRKGKKGEKKAKAQVVFTLWHNDGEYGEYYSAQPKLEGDKYGVSLAEALNLHARGEGIFTLFVFDTINPPPLKDPDFA